MFNWSPLATSINLHNMDMIRILLKNPNIDINQECKTIVIYTFMAFYINSFWRLYIYILIMLKHKYIHEMTPFHLALFKKDYEIAKLLVSDPRFKQ